MSRLNVRRPGGAVSSQRDIYSLARITANERLYFVCRLIRFFFKAKFCAPKAFLRFLAVHTFLSSLFQQAQLHTQKEKRRGKKKDRKSSFLHAVFCRQVVSQLTNDRDPSNILGPDF